MHKAVSFGLLVQAMIDEEDDVNAKNMSGDTPLHLAVSNSEVEIGQHLIENGANVNIHNNSGQAPLHLAVINGEVEIVRLLIDNGADANGNAEKRTIIDSLNSNSYETPLYLTVKNGYIEIIKTLIENGADVNARYDENRLFGGRPLDVAVANGDYKMVELLIKSGADTNLLIITMKSLLYYAIEKDWHNVVEILLDKGANPNKYCMTHIVIGIITGLSKMIIPNIGIYKHSQKNVGKLLVKNNIFQPQAAAN